MQSTVTLKADDIIVTIPLALKRRQGRAEVLTPEKAKDSESFDTCAPLALTIARAHRWQKLLEEGRYASIRELARAAGVDNSYLARLLRVTLLAPDITEAILEGVEPDGLSLDFLYKMPAEWGEQRRVLGFSRLQQR